MIEHKSKLTQFYCSCSLQPKVATLPPASPCFVKPFYVFVFRHSDSNQDVEKTDKLEISVRQKVLGSGSKGSRCDVGSTQCGAKIILMTNFPLKLSWLLNYKPFEI